jgi:hypothetical protein
VRFEPLWSVLAHELRVQRVCLDTFRVEQNRIVRNRTSTLPHHDVEAYQSGFDGADYLWLINAKYSTS